MRGLRLLLLLLFTICSYYSVAFRPPDVSEEIGCSPTLSALLRTRDPFYFDPLCIGNDENFGRLREAELKHGRVAMLAVAETILVPALKWIGSQTIENIPWPELPLSLFPGSHEPNIGFLNDIPSGILPSIQSLRIEDLAKVILTCGMLETFIFVQRDPNAMPGDYNTGYFGIRDKAQNERALICELENGRLAMLAFVAQIGAEFVSGGQPWEVQWLAFLQPWEEQWITLLKGWVRELG